MSKCHSIYRNGEHFRGSELFLPIPRGKKGFFLTKDEMKGAFQFLREQRETFLIGLCAAFQALKELADEAKKEAVRVQE